MNLGIKGQAVIEYLLVFAFLTLISINLVKGLSRVMNKSMGNLSYVLTQHLSVGVCKGSCFLDAFGNYREQ